MITNDFCVFILTHGRPDNIYTDKTLRKQGYTGPIYYIVDNEDKSQQKYIENYGSKIIIFNKKEIADQTDQCHNFDDRNTIIYARNFCFNAARQLGYKYFIQMDDDYVSFEHRFVSKDGKKLMVKKPENMDFVFMKYLEFYKSIPYKSIAMAQGGDFIGGVNNQYARKMPFIRKCMNSFFCSTEKEFKFLGAFNEDVITYTSHGSRGELFGTIPLISLVQKQTQTNQGGITELYKKYGTYVKLFSSVMVMPSAVKVRYLQTTNKRFHHVINWANCVPVIISQKNKKYE